SLRRRECAIFEAFCAVPSGGGGSEHMKTVLFLALVICSLPAYGWEPVCQFTFNKEYDGVHVGKVSVFREWKGPQQWRFAVGVRGLSVKGTCPGKARRTGYVLARVASSEGGFLDTGDILVTGQREETVWRVFDPVYLKDCADGAV